MLRDIPLRTRRKQSAKRDGLSILEVMVSIGILVLGLLGVIALIPIAAQKLRQGIALDDATAVARAGVADLQARDGTNIQKWLRYQPQGFRLPAAANPPTVNSMSNLWGVQMSNPSFPDSFVAPTWAICIDPMMYESAIIQNGAGLDACFFPYQPNGATLDASAVRNGLMGTVPGRMLRVTMNWNAIDWRTRSSNFPNQAVFPFDPVSFNVGLANSMCVSTDDLLLTSPGQEPSEGMLGITVSQTDAPASQHDVSMQSWDDPLATPTKRNADSRISWFATLVPLPGSIAGGSRYCTLSVAVVERRDLTVDITRANVVDSTTDALQNVESERTTGVRFIGGGLAGGEVQLVSYRTPDPPVASDPDDTNSINTLLAKKSLTSVREGNWILISGPGGAMGHIFYWYRIASIDPQPSRNPFNSSEIVRTATLRGPDWPVGVAYPNGMAEATIISNVINVFEQTVDVREE